MALKQCVRVCTLLSYQTELIRNTYCLRVSLIQHLITSVIPLPQPSSALSTAKGDCFWRRTPMRYETQAHLLRMLDLVTRHYSAAVFSLRVTRSFDAARVLTLSCLTCLADVIARTKACDVPSEFSMHLNGEIDGPTDAFGIEVSGFLQSSRSFRFVSPELATCRTQVLDYFYKQRAILRDDHIIFRYEDKMRWHAADARLMSQLCLCMGFPQGDQGAMLPLYFTGEEPEIIDNYPEFAFLRNIVLFFKLSMSNNLEDLPPIQPWMCTDARMHWMFEKKKDLKEAINVFDWSQGTLVVRAFGRQKLVCAEFVPSTFDSGNVFQKIGKFFKGKHPRVLPSDANPSLLVNKKITEEEDVLHIKKLPDFEGTLSQRYCELLLQYLTVPYLRIPLVINFFADESRLPALSNPSLQSVLDSCMFEPAEWQQADNREIPTSIPDLDRRHLHTPVRVGGRDGVVLGYTHGMHTRPLTSSLHSHALTHSHTHSLCLTLSLTHTCTHSVSHADSHSLTQTHANAGGIAVQRAHILALSIARVFGQDAEPGAV